MGVREGNCFRGRLGSWKKDGYLLELWILAATRECGDIPVEYRSSNEI